MQLAIAVVYVVHDGDGSLLDLHLGQIERHTTVPYRIYAAVNRLQAQFRELLLARPDVEVCDCESTRLRGVREHSHYLTQLVDRALSDGASHVAALHVDSFPIRQRWAAELAARLKPDVELAAVALQEIGTESLPRTTCLFCPREFYSTYGPVVTVTDLPRAHWLYRQYRNLRPGPDDPGDPYGFVLHNCQLGWHKMLRTNGADDHYLLGGIYDDLVFHLGAAAPGRRFYLPPPSSGNRVVRRNLVHRVGSALVPHRVRAAVPDGIRRLWSTADVARSADNRRAFEDIRSKLLADPQAYISYLRTGRPGDAESREP